MNVLGTKFSAAMSSRNGWYSFNEVLEDSFKQYTFNQCLKLKVTPETKDNMDFVQWVMYWENSPVAVHMYVLPTVLPNGFVKVTIISKKHVFIDEFGEYPGKSTVMDGYIEDGKFFDKKGLEKHLQEKLNRGDFK